MARKHFAPVRLAAGVRNFRMRYFQGLREHIALVLGWKRQVYEADHSCGLAASGSMTSRSPSSRTAVPRSRHSACMRV